MIRSIRRHKEYQQLFSEDDVVLVRFTHIGETGVVFSVQYLARINREWQPIVRFDTAHGHAHVDISHPSGTQETRKLSVSSYHEAPVMAVDDI